MADILNKRIEKYIQQHSVMTLATSKEGHPYCCNVFYAFDNLHCRFYFQSSDETRHMREALINSNVAGTIVQENIYISRLRGLQFTGKILFDSMDIDSKGSELYSKQFPFSRIYNQKLRIIEIDFIKMTDNTLGFGKKLLWQRSSAETAISCINENI